MSEAGLVGSSCLQVMVCVLVVIALYSSIFIILSISMISTFIILLLSMI